MILTIAVCSYNRSNLLVTAIESLINQFDNNYQFELLIIDNNSSDDTNAIVEKYKTSFPFIKYFKELKPGISNARNRAIEEAQGEYIGFIDDDAKASKNYIQKAFAIINNYKPDIFGGKILPYYLTAKPNWFKDDYETRIHGSTGWLKKANLSASNLFIKKSLFNELGKFSLSYGGEGNKMIYGEETEFINRAYQLQRKVYYDLELIVYHLVPEYKMNPLFFMTSNYAMGKAYFNITKNIKVTDCKSLLDLLDLFFSDLNLTLRNKHVNLENYFIEKLVADINLIGQHSEFLRQSEKGGLNAYDLTKMYKHKNKIITTRMFLSSMANLLLLYKKSLFK
jgi:glycosyltransferase involved in cell wall biosynthesis